MEYLEFAQRRLEYEKDVGRRMHMLKEMHRMRSTEEQERLRNPDVAHTTRLITVDALRKKTTGVRNETNAAFVAEEKYNMRITSEEKKKLEADHKLMMDAIEAKETVERERREELERDAAKMKRREEEAAILQQQFEEEARSFALIQAEEQRKRDEIESKARMKAAVAAAKAKQ